MKRYALVTIMSSLCILSFCIFTGQAAYAAFDSGSTGADGEFAPTANTALQLPASGVFNFTTVNIPAGVTVTFIKNAQNTPVTILAAGNVTIAGTINVSGNNAASTFFGTGGPGGYNGGSAGSFLLPGTRGEGPGAGGGGGACTTFDNYSAGGGGGSFGVAGSSGTNNSNCPAASPGYAGAIYGNERILPVLGGSGGGGGGSARATLGGGGGGGGGALVIASSGTINVTGSILANGGNAAAGNNTWVPGGGGGSGGSIRLIATSIAGNGLIQAIKGNGAGPNIYGGNGGDGRIRLEAETMTRTSQTSPPAPPLAPPYGVQPQNVPVLTITSIGGVSVPTAPTGSFSAPDVLLPYNAQNPMTVQVAGTNVPVGTTVSLKASPTVGNASTASGTLAGTDASSTVSIPLTISRANPSLITASVTLTLASLGMGPIYAQGEPVEKVRIETSMGGGSWMIYITASGREIPAERLRS